MERYRAFAPRWAYHFPLMKILLANPRGFCAGVYMAIDVVDQLLDICGVGEGGEKIYVYHEIVHNRHVVQRFRDRGAVFVESIDEVPEGATVVFSAHGVSPAVRAESRAKKLTAIDATCPLVMKVHAEAIRYAKRGWQILLVGHEDHQEVIGTRGEAPDSIQVVESPDDIPNLVINDPEKLVYLTQTTLSLDDANVIIKALKKAFPKLNEPPSSDICYATTNRQAAVKEVAPHVDAVIVVGSPNSSNSQRLREVAERAGAPAQLVQGRGEIDWSIFGSISSLGITAGASAPEVLVEEIMDAFSERYEISIETVSTADESVSFPLPKELRAIA